jgi:uncharacterized protein YjbI with pentapeptide repeats
MLIARLFVLEMRRFSMSEQDANKTTNAIINEKPDAKALLDAANSASERVSGLHVAFMAVCVYVLVIVFSTTDLGLMMDKGIKLPIMDVEVPIVGFYLFAPYIVVLVHFNLLLQLQLLSQKLFAFDAAVSQQENSGGLRDQLHIFPYTYYLVGRPNSLVHALIGLMVSITLVLLPFATLIVLQLQFLAYQSEAVTWWQRAATWLDLTVIVILWPIIMDSQDDWQRYWHALIVKHVPQRRNWAIFTLLLLSLLLLLFSVSWELTTIGLVLLLLAPLMAILLYDKKNMPRARILYLLLMVTAALVFMILGLWMVNTHLQISYGTHLQISWQDIPKILETSLVQDKLILSVLGPLLLIPMSLLWHTKAPRGSLALLMMLFIGLPAPLAMIVDGEGLERFVLYVQPSQSRITRFWYVFKWSPDQKLVDKEDLKNYILPARNTTVFSTVLKRQLDLSEQLLMANPPKPETIALIRSGNYQEALKQIEPINLRNRNLRHANMLEAIVVGGDLRDNNLQSANLADANLQGAGLSGANLQGANLCVANLQSANLADANLQGANLSEVNLQGAYLSGAVLKGANLWGANLQGVNLTYADLQGAVLTSASLQGANLSGAKLQGANLSGAKLQGANLKGAELQEARLVDAELQGTILEYAELYRVVLNKRLELAAQLVDARGIDWSPLNKQEQSDIVSSFEYIQDINLRKESLITLQDAFQKKTTILHFESCLAPKDTLLVCPNRFDPNIPDKLHDFTKQLHKYLGKLACESPEIAHGILEQIPGLGTDPTAVSETRRGLEIELKWLLNDKSCIGLQKLTDEEKSRLRDMK